jgi:hypothetical protein
MPRIKDEIGITTTQVKAGINPHKTNQLGATRTKGTNTPKGVIIKKNAKGKIMLKQTSLVPFVVISVITLTTAPRSLISNG